MANKSVTKVNRMTWHNKKKCLIIHLAGGDKEEIYQSSGKSKAADNGKDEKK